MSKSLGTLKVLITGDAKKLNKALSATENRLRRSSRKWKAYGSSMTSAFTVPFALVGGASVKLASDLETNFAKIENLVGITGTTLDNFKKSVASISSEVGQSQSKLSEALFTVTSAGLRGSEAIEVLRQSAKASAIGMGETSEVARAATGVIQAYGKENISAARAVDVMTTTVREGNLAAADLAPVLGRVTGLAANMGISFEEIGANIATFTRLGVGAEEAVTALRGTMNTFLKATPDTRKALESVGLSLDGVRNKIRGDGLAETLVMLMQKFKGNQDGLAKLIPNVRALSGVLGVAGKQSGKYLEIVKNIQAQNNIVDKGFKKVSQTAGFKFKAALVDLQNAGIQLGKTLVPYALDAVKAISSLVDKFKNLSPETKSVIARLGLMAAAIGPLVSVVGHLKGAYGGLFGVLRGIVPLLTAGWVGTLGIALAGLAAAIGYLTKRHSSLNQQLETQRQKYDNLIVGSNSLFDGLEQVDKILKTTKKNSIEYNIALGTKESLIKSINEKYGQYLPNLLSEKSTTEDISKAQKALNRELLKKQLIMSYNEEINNAIKKEIKARKTLIQIQKDRVTGVEAEMNKTLESAGTMHAVLFTEVDLLKKITDKRIQANKKQIESSKELRNNITASYKIMADEMDIAWGTVLNSIDNTISKIEKKAKDVVVDVDAKVKNPVWFAEGFIKMISLQKETIKINEKLKQSFKNLGKSIKYNMSSAMETMKTFHDTISQGLTTMINDGLKVAAEGFADMFAAIVTGGDIGSAFRGLLDGLIGVLQTFAKLAITTGIAALGIKKALQLSPAGAIAGGVALLALTQIVKSSLANMNQDVPGYAAGGIFGGESFIKVGEYPGAFRNKEVVTPIDKLQSMLDLNSYGNKLDVAISINSQMRGNDIYQSVRRTEIKNKRA